MTKLKRNIRRNCYIWFKYTYIQYLLKMRGLERQLEKNTIQRT